MNRSRAGWLAVLSLLLSCAFLSTAMASPILDFFVPVTQSGAHINYAVSGGPLTGTNIAINQLAALDTPQNAGTYQCIMCVLNFTTGKYTGGGNATWNFGSGGSITISGCVDVDNDGGSCDSSDIQSATLLSGQFGFASVTPFGNTFKIAGSEFFDVKDANLAAFFGLPSKGWVGNFNLSFDANGLPPSTFTSSQVIGGDVANTLVPEPSSLLLLVTGLGGVFGVARKRLGKGY